MNFFGSITLFFAVLYNSQISHRSAATANTNEKKSDLKLNVNINVNGVKKGNVVPASELVPPSLCKALNDTCGYQATHPPKQHGDCCVGMKCQRTGLGGAGRCVIGKCKNHGEKCGRQAIIGSKDYGKCCEGSICQAEKLGGIMKCVKVPKLRKEGEPCGGCFAHWCPDSCKDELCGKCEKGLECNRENLLREAPGRCKKRTETNSDEKCTPGDRKPAGDGCNDIICGNDGTWGGMTMVLC